MRTSLICADKLWAASRRSSRIRTQASIFAILNEVLNYSVFDRAALLAGHPKLSRLMEEMSAKEAAWIAHRVATRPPVRKHSLDARRGTLFEVTW